MSSSDNDFDNFDLGMDFDQSEGDFDPEALDGKSAPPPPPPRDPNKPTARGMRFVAFSAVAGCLSLIVLGLASWLIGQELFKEVDLALQTAKEQGYTIIEKTSDKFTVDKPVTQKTFYKIQGTIALIADCNADIIVDATACNISGNINKTLKFTGEQLTIWREATVQRLEGRGKVLTIYGKVVENKAEFASTRIE